MGQPSAKTLVSLQVRPADGCQTRWYPGMKRLSGSAFNSCFGDSQNLCQSELGWGHSSGGRNFMPNSTPQPYWALLFLSRSPRTRRISRREVASGALGSRRPTWGRFARPRRSRTVPGPRSQQTSAQHGDVSKSGSPLPGFIVWCSNWEHVTHKTWRRSSDQGGDRQEHPANVLQDHASRWIEQLGGFGQKWTSPAWSWASPTTRHHSDEHPNAWRDDQERPPFFSASRLRCWWWGCLSPARSTWQSRGQKRPVAAPGSHPQKGKSSLANWSGTRPQRQPPPAHGPLVLKKRGHAGTLFFKEVVRMSVTTCMMRTCSKKIWTNKPANKQTQPNAAQPNQGTEPNQTKPTKQSWYIKPLCERPTCSALQLSTLLIFMLVLSSHLSRQARGNKVSFLRRCWRSYLASSRQKPDLHPNSRQATAEVSLTLS